MARQQFIDLGSESLKVREHRFLELARGFPVPNFYRLLIRRQRAFDLIF